MGQDRTGHDRTVVRTEDMTGQDRTGDSAGDRTGPRQIMKFRSNK